MLCSVLFPSFFYLTYLCINIKWLQSIAEIWYDTSVWYLKGKISSEKIDEKIYLRRLMEISLGEYFMIVYIQRQSNDSTRIFWNINIWLIYDLFNIQTAFNSLSFISVHKCKTMTSHKLKFKILFMFDKKNWKLKCLMREKCIWRSQTNGFSLSKRKN